MQTTQSGGSGTRWMYASSGQMLFWAKGPSNPTTHENVYLAGSLVAIIDRDGPSNAVTATEYQHTDALGSPVATSNEAGAIIERTNYDPYGGPIGKTVNGLGYTGHVMDGATGLTYMQQRYYDQGVGRFLSVDPVTASSANGGNFNRYWYGRNNAYGFTDPDGRLAQSRNPWGEGQERPWDPCERVCLGKPAKDESPQPKPAGEVKSSPGESRGKFVLRLAKTMRAKADETGFEVCGEICPTAEGGYSTKLYTSESRVVCARIDQCGKVDSIHAHGKDGSFKINAIDSRYLKSQGHVQADEGRRWPGQNLNSFSPADFDDVPGSLAGKKGCVLSEWRRHNHILRRLFR